jgi:ribosomal protein L7Ae-like RNA K-turn-binding protein
MYSFLGLIQKSGNLSSGDESVEIDIKKGRCRLLIIAEDASENTKKRFEDMARYRKVPYVFFGSKTELGLGLGKSDRAVIALKNEGFANAFLKKLNCNNGGEGIVKSENT